MKKKIILFACAVIAAASLWAQDIIVTNDAQKIEAKILEVSKTEIKYKEKSNLNGPTFILETKEISSIVYSNGKVVLYNQEQPAQVAKQVEEQKQSAAQVVEENTVEVLLLSGKTIVAPLVEMKANYVSCVMNGKTEVIPASQIDKVTLLANGQIREYGGRGVYVSEEIKTTSEQTTASSATTASKSGRIYRDNGQYLHNDIYISVKEVERILERENPAAYKEWKKAEGMSIAGGVFDGIGIGLAIGGLFTLLPQYRLYTACIGIECGALASLGVGLGLTFGASAHYNKAIDIYNSKYDHAAVQLKWHVAPTEVGLALVF